MKKIIISLAALASVAFVSCKKELNEDLTVPSSANTTFSVSLAETKTTLDGTLVKWAEGDQIRIYGYSSTGTDSKIYTLQSGAGSRSAVFENTEDPIGEFDQYFAVYPAEDKFALAPEALPGKLSIKSAFSLTGQAAVENGFDPSFALMLAQANSDKQLVFKYGVGFIKITIPVDNVTAVSISSDKSWTCKRPEYNPDGTFNKANSGTSEVSATGNFIKGSSYYLLAPARDTNFGNITVSYTINGAEESFTGSVSKSIVNGEIFDLGTPWADRTPELTIIKNSINNVPAEGGNDLTTENAYSLKYCADSDITVTTDGNVITAATISEGTITFSASANTDEESREGYIYLKLGENETEAITVNQLGTESVAVKETHEWDFSSFTDEEMQTITGLAADAKATAGQTWNFGDGLTMVTNSSSKWNNQTIDGVQYKWVATGGKYGSNQKFFSFITESVGTLTVLYTSGGNAARALTVNAGSSETTDSDNVSASTTELKTVTFSSVAAGTVLLYSKDDNVRIYSIHFEQD